MSDVVGKTNDLIVSLGELTPHGAALAESALALAGDIDTPPLDTSGSPRPITASVNSWRVTVAELIERGTVSAIDEDDEADWHSAASRAGATPIRHTA